MDIFQPDITTTLVKTLYVFKILFITSYENVNVYTICSLAGPTGLGLYLYNTLHFFFFVDKCTTHYLSCTHIACIKGNLLYNFKHTEIYILFCHSLSLSLASLSLSIFSQHGIKVFIIIFLTNEKWTGDN